MTPEPMKPDAWDIGAQDALRYDAYDPPEGEDEEMYRAGYGVGMDANLEIQGGHAPQRARGIYAHKFLTGNM